MRDLAVPLSNVAFLDCQIQNKLFAYAAKLEARYTSASEHVERLIPSHKGIIFPASKGVSGRVGESRARMKAE